MRRFSHLLLVPVLALTLAACGSARGSKDTDADTDAETPPTNASVEDYCAAFRGDEMGLDEESTVADFVAALETGTQKVEETGTPANMTDQQRDAFERQLENARDVIAVLKEKDQDMLASELGNDPVFVEDTEAKMETPKELGEYASENC